MLWNSKPVKRSAIPGIWPRNPTYPTYGKPQSPYYYCYHRILSPVTNRIGAFTSFLILAKIIVQVNSTESALYVLRHFILGVLLLCCWRKVFTYMSSCLSSLYRTLTLSLTPFSTLTTAASPASKFSNLNKLSLRNSYHSFSSLFSQRLASRLTHQGPLFCLSDFGRL